MQKSLTGAGHYQIEANNRNKQQTKQQLSIMLNNRKRNDEECNDDTQSRTSCNPKGCFIDKVEVSNVNEDDDGIGTILCKVLVKPQASKKAE